MRDPRFRVMHHGEELSLVRRSSDGLEAAGRLPDEARGSDGSDRLDPSDLSDELDPLAEDQEP